MTANRPQATIDSGAPALDVPPKRVLKMVRAQRPIVTVIVVLMTVWQVTTNFLPDIVAPPLTDIADSVVTILTDWSLAQQLLYTAARVLFALTVAFIGGLVLGIAMGISKRFSEYARSLLYLLQGVPALSWVVFAVIWFSNLELRIAFILVIVTLPQFALYVDAAVRSVDSKLLEVARSFRASPIQRFRMIIVPAIVPSILSAWSVNLGNGIRVAMVAELVGATSGVGFQLLRSQSIYDMSGAIAWTLLLVCYLLLLQGILALIEAKLLNWRAGESQNV
ncbi:MAG: ABC transporter permease [Nocardioidaceae bacterium]